MSDMTIKQIVKKHGIPVMVRSKDWKPGRYFIVKRKTPSLFGQDFEGWDESGDLVGYHGGYSVWEAIEKPRSRKHVLALLREYSISGLHVVK